MAKKKMKTSKTAYLIIAFICLVLCEVLPIFTEKIPQFGTGLRPMHFPVLIAGFACGPWLASMLVIAGRMQTQFTYHMFIAYAFVDAVPGIIVQIVLIPAIVIILEKANLTYRGRK